MEVHWSDCAVNNGPAYPAGPCDCGMLELTENLAEQWVAASIADARSGGLLVQNPVADGFIEKQDFPTCPLVTDAGASRGVV